MEEKKPEVGLRLAAGAVAKVSRPLGLTSKYAEVCSVNVTAEDFILEFGDRNPNDLTETIVHTRIALSLFHAKRLSNVLLKIIKSYEVSFGEIEVDPVKRLKTKIPEVNK